MLRIINSGTQPSGQRKCHFQEMPHRQFCFRMMKPKIRLSVPEVVPPTSTSQNQCKQPHRAHPDVPLHESMDTQCLVSKLSYVLWFQESSNPSPDPKVLCLHASDTSAVSSQLAPCPQQIRGRVYLHLLLRPIAYLERSTQTKQETSRSSYGCSSRLPQRLSSLSSLIRALMGVSEQNTVEKGFLPFFRPKKLKRFLA